MRRQRIASQSGRMALVLAALLLGAGLPAGTAWAAAAQYTTQFPLEQCSLVTKGRNPHFSLNPGDWLLFEGETREGIGRLQITVLDEEETIAFVTENGVSLTVKARVVEEQEWVDDELVEVSRNFYARCKETNDIYYFGEDVDIFEDGVVSHAGAWRAGQDGALPGLIMPGTFLLGSRYVQERAPGVAEDRAEHVQMGLTVTVPAGVFTSCVEVLETTPLEPGAKSVKRYCPGIGLVVDDVVELVDFSVAD